MKFRNECWSGLPFPPPGDLPNSGNEPRFPSLQADSLPSEPSGNPIIKILVKSIFRIFSIVTTQLLLTAELHRYSSCIIFCFSQDNKSLFLKGPLFASCLSLKPFTIMRRHWCPINSIFLLETMIQEPSTLLSSLCFQSGLAAAQLPGWDFPLSPTQEIPTGLLSLLSCLPYSLIVLELTLL